MKVKTFVGRPGNALDSQVNAELQSGNSYRTQHFVQEIKMSGVSRDGMVCIMVVWGEIPTT